MYIYRTYVLLNWEVNAFSFTLRSHFQHNALGPSNTIRRGFSGAKRTKVWLYRKDRTLTATYSVSYFSRRTVTKDHVTDLRMLRLCKIQRHSWEWMNSERATFVDAAIVKRTGLHVQLSCRIGAEPHPVWWVPFYHNPAQYLTVKIETGFSAKHSLMKSWPHFSLISCVQFYRFTAFIKTQ